MTATIRTIFLVAAHCLLACHMVPPPRVVFPVIRARKFLRPDKRIGREDVRGVKRRLDFPNPGGGLTTGQGARASRVGRMWGASG